MNKLDVSSPVLTTNPASFSDLRPARRLIVLVPSLEFDSAPIIRRVWELASVTGAQVLFLGLYTDPAQELSLRRGLVTMAAMVKDDKISTEAQAIFGKDWLDAVRAHAQTGDTVVCLAEHHVGLPHRPLSQVLQSNVGLPLYILSDLSPRGNSRPNRLPQLAAWIGSAVIILGFFLLQIKMGPLAQDWAHTALLMISIFVEFWTIWFWNSLFG